MIWFNVFVIRHAIPDMEVPTESIDKSLLEFNNLLSPANLL